MASLCVSVRDRHVWSVILMFTDAAMYLRFVMGTARIPTRPSNDKLGVSKKGLSPLDLPPGLYIRTVLSSREPPRAQISTK